MECNTFAKQAIFYFAKNYYSEPILVRKNNSIRKTNELKKVYSTYSNIAYDFLLKTVWLIVFLSVFRGVVALSILLSNANL